MGSSGSEKERSEVAAEVVNSHVIRVTTTDPTIYGSPLSRLQQEEFEVEALVKRFEEKDGRVFYFVKWKGYGEHDNTWEPREGLTGCLDLIENFEKARVKLEKVKKKKEKREKEPSPKPTSIFDTLLASGAVANGYLREYFNLEDGNEKGKGSKKKAKNQAPPSKSKEKNRVATTPKKKDGRGRPRKLDDKNEKFIDDNRSPCSSLSSSKKTSKATPPSKRKSETAQKSVAKRPKIVDKSKSKVKRESDQGDGKKNIYYSATQEDVDLAFYGPRFRRYWRESEKPLCIAGEVTCEGYQLYLVRLQTSNETEEELAAIKLNPLEGANETNSVLTSWNTLRKELPDLLTQYYQNNTNFVSQAKTEQEVAQDAARASMFHTFFKHKVRVDATSIFNDMMGDPNSHKGPHFLDKCEAKKGKGKDGDESDDSFGLPDEYGASSSEDDKKAGESSSSSGSEDDYVFKEVKISVKKKKKKM